VGGKFSRKMAFSLNGLHHSQISYVILIEEDERERD